MIRPMTSRLFLVLSALSATLAVAIPAQADTCAVLYDLDGTFAVTSTDFGKGDTTAPGLRGSLVMEYTADAKGQAVDGPVNMLHYSMYIDFADDSVVDVTTKVHHFAPTCSGDPMPSWRLSTDAGFPARCEYRGNKKPVASGTYTKAKGVIKWDACNAAGTYWAKSRKAYTLSSKSTGKGCLNNLHAVGNVYCDGHTGCRLGDLQPGNNPSSDTWNQPLIHGPPGSDNTVSVAPDQSTITTPTGKVSGGELSYEVPNNAPSRTWVSWKAKINRASQVTTCGRAEAK